MKLIFILIKLFILFTLLLVILSILHNHLKSIVRILLFKGQKITATIGWMFILLFVFYAAYQVHLQFFLNSPEYEKNRRLYDVRAWFEEASTAKGGIYDRHHSAEKQLARYQRDEKTGQINRVYPLGEATSHLLGYSTINRDRSGIEKDYLDKLMGRSKGSLSELKNYLRNKWIRLYPKGNDLVLTIDYDLQALAYQLLRDRKRKGAVVMIEPKTGYVLALVSAPGFNPQAAANDSLWNALATDQKNAPLYNRALRGLYPPGSTFKTVVAAAALEKGKHPRFYCSSRGIKLHGYRKRITDHSGHHGRLDLRDAYKKSCNQYFAQLGMRLTPQTIKWMAEKLCFNKQLQWNTSNKSFQKDFRISKSVFPQAAKLDSFRTGWASIGQDQVLATPMQMALVAATVANDGKMPMPCLEMGRWSATFKRAFSGATARKLRDMMTAVVEEDGTAYTARIPGLPIAGKTGTAEVANGRPHSWFISFAPANDPKIAMAVVCENSGYGASVAAPISRKLYLKAVKLGYLQRKNK